MSANNQTATLPSMTLEQFTELRAAGLQELYSIRSQAMKQAVEDLQGFLQETPPAASIPWKLSAEHFGFHLGGSLFNPMAWELIRAHLAAKTAVHMAGHDFGNGVTGYTLARHIEADLHALALDGWAGLPAHGLSTIGGAANV